MLINTDRDLKAKHDDIAQEIEGKSLPGMVQ